MTEDQEMSLLSVPASNEGRWCTVNHVICKDGTSKNHHAFYFKTKKEMVKWINMNREIKYWIAVLNLMYQEGEINLLERFSFYCRWIDYCHEFHEAFGDAKVPIDICWAINCRVCI